MSRAEVLIIGGGLAGSEAAWQAAERGVTVELREMRPARMTPAHRGAGLAELVCSNSFKSEVETTGSGLLKRELRALGGLLVELAAAARVPAGTALAVDRERFSAAVEARLTAHPRIRLVREEVAELPGDRPVLVATGPLTSDALAANLAARLGTASLFFFDAIAPIVDADTIDRERVFAQSRYGHGDDYLNCFLDRATYLELREALVHAERAPLAHFDRELLFEACLPVEELAERGELTLAFGPLRPVGLVDPRTGRRPFAAVQLRAENQARTMFGLVGFQTRLRHGEQLRIFRRIPGLEQAQFLRLGSMHRNAFVDAPRLLGADLCVRGSDRLLIAGQLTGAEGYVEAQSTGFVAGVNLARVARGEPPCSLPPETAIGALCRHLATAPVRPFQPMNFNFGLLPPLDGGRGGRRARKQAQVERAAAALDGAIASAPDWRVAEVAAAPARSSEDG
ncbi:MAG: methylenetetrahydrofolate--tRNA-(uracil(54)-C(5))-methyltransferase (FADH(2)-oxidizing) TrmFO [Candidatus Eiseniibacteriota bacterium]|jgi:methylenetetrahydrofolate--tRNA-(uracil-5-)-methyltransferase